MLLHEVCRSLTLYYLHSEAIHFTLHNQLFAYIHFDLSAY